MIICTRKILKGRNTIIKRICSVLLMMMIMGLPFIVRGNEAESGNKQVVKVGYVDGYGVLMEIGTQGYNGFWHEYFREISKYSEYDYEFIACTWEEVFDLLDAGVIDLFGPVGITPERLAKYTYTKLPFAEEEILLTKLVDDSEVIRSNDYIQNSLIGVYNSSTHDSFLQAYLDKNEIQAEIVYSSDISSQGIIEGVYDFKVAGSMEFEEGLEAIVKIGVEPLYYIATKENQSIIEEIDAAMQQIVEKDHLFNERLYLKYYGDSRVIQPTVFKVDTSLLQSKEEYIVGISTQNQPISYINDEGEPDGIAIEVLNLIAKEAGITVRYVPYNDKIDSKIQLDLNLSILEDEVKNQEYLWTVPYMTTPLMFIGQGETNIEATNQMGMLNYGESYKDRVEEVYPGAVVTVYGTLDELIEAFKEKKLQYIICTGLETEIFLSELGSQDYYIHPFNFYKPLSIGISPKLGKEYMKIFDELIHQIDQIKLESIIIENRQELQGLQSIVEILRENQLTLTMSISILLVIILLTVLKMSIDKKEVLSKILYHDRLTGLETEYGFRDKATKVLAYAQPEEYFLLSIDIDNFKYINEVYGYKVGTQILKKFALFLKRTLPYHETLARQHADRFIVLIRLTPESREYYGELSFKKSFNFSVKETLGEGYKLKISIGMYMIHDPTQSLTHIMDCANYARNSVKSTYGNTFVRYTHDMELIRAEHNSIVIAMERGIDNKEFVLYYQLKIDLQTGKINGAEALVRWVIDEDKIIYPNMFIPIFEKNGFIVRLDFYVFEEVCAFIHKRKRMDIGKISVNLSGATLLSRNLIERIIEIVEKYQVHPSSLEIEVTESALVDNFEEINTRISILKELGFTLSIDDFGSGVSSFNRLKDMNIDILKVDRTFLNKALEKAKGVAIIENIINLSRKLDLITVAEGVEEAHQVELLKKLGCDIAQGYYFSPPVHEKEFISIVTDYNDTNV